MATLAAEENMPVKNVDDSQGSSVSSEAVAAGGGVTDYRMDVGQSSASEADLPDDDSSYQGSVDEETLLCSPSQEMESEAGTATTCSAHQWYSLWNYTQTR